MSFKKLAPLPPKPKKHLPLPPKPKHAPKHAPKHHHKPVPGQGR
ncbi:hypothetical protein [Streptomyces malaysiense]|nr:hypothetical protein [Streptomyces malaysiense]